jgi:hypothetical protein
LRVGKDSELDIPPKVVEGEVVKPVTTWADVRKSWSEAWGEIKTAVEKAQVEKVCKNCKHWEDRKGFDENIPEKYSEYKSCAIADGKAGEGPIIDGAKAFAVDAEYYYAVLVTAPEFGCNQFEVKEG